MNPIFNRLVLVLLLGSIFVSLNAQEYDWKLKKKTDELSVYYRKRPDSKINELKLTTTIEARLSTVVALLRDTEACPQWVYNCVKSEIVKTEGPFRYIYSEMNFPWPLSNRDFYARTHITQDKDTRVVTSRLVAMPGFRPEKEDMVRIPEMNVTWIFTPIGKNLIRLDYLLASDPGGALPSWLINMALDKGPTKSIAQFKKMLQYPKYTGQSFAFIDDE